MALEPEQQAQRIRELFRRLAEVSDPVKLEELKAELRHLLVRQAPLGKPSPRQLRIIEMVAGGMKNRDVAEHLGITEQGVKNHLNKIFANLEVNNRTQLALWYERQVHAGRLQRPT